MSSKRSEKTALVLSAGGMFGAWQAGVWAALDEAGFEPEIVVGASVGSLNGWLVACRTSGADLIDQWRDIGAISELRWRVPRSPLEGLLDPSALEETVRAICSCSAPEAEFGVVATELRSMKPALFRTPELTWQHLMASCAVPLFLPQQRIEGLYYSDGGIVDPLPLWAALAMGATRVIGVNALATMRWPLRAGLAVVRGLTGYRPVLERPGVEIEIVEPRGSLGTPSDSMRWRRDNVDRWIEAGRRDSESAAAKVVEWRSRVNAGYGVPRQEHGTACPSTESIA